MKKGGIKMFNLITSKKRNNIFDFSNFLADVIPNNKFMKLDIKETPTNYEIEVELPGVSKENINVSVSDDILTISVNKIAEASTEGTKYLKKERKFGEYKRSFSIPDINPEQITAQYHNGILKINIMKLDKHPSTTKYIDIE